MRFGGFARAASLASGVILLMAACEPSGTGAAVSQARTLFGDLAALVTSPMRSGDSLDREDERLSARQAVATGKFLDSIGINTTFPDRGQPIEMTIDMVRYAGFRWVRAGIEGLSDSGPTTIDTYLELHRRTGAKLSMGLGSGRSDLPGLLHNGRILARAGALLAFEGNNEPNNWPVTYKGERGGGLLSWLPVAQLQRDLYTAVKADPLLAKYPVWSVSAAGAEKNNVGLQFLTIAPGAATLMPDGTRYADFANLHNYFYHPNSASPADNKVWDAADPTSAARVDGLYGNFGRTWMKGFRGYSQEQLDTLPRVTTETGTTITDTVTEDMQGKHLVNLYLAQFKRGFSHTAVYILRDRTDEGGNQTFGFFGPDYVPRKAALYLHNLTTILADAGHRRAPGKLAFAIPDKPATTHSLLLQASDGRFQLVVWNERLEGADTITVRFAAPHARVSIFDPMSGTAAARECRNCDRVELTLSDHPNVVVVSR